MGGCDQFITAPLCRSFPVTLFLAPAWALHSGWGLLEWTQSSADCPWAREKYLLHHAAPPFPNPFLLLMFPLLFLIISLFPPSLSAVFAISCVAFPEEPPSCLRGSAVTCGGSVGVSWNGMCQHRYYGLTPDALSCSSNYQHLATCTLHRHDNWQTWAHPFRTTGSPIKGLCCLHVLERSLWVWSLEMEHIFNLFISWYQSYNCYHYQEPFLCYCIEFSCNK